MSIYKFFLDRNKIFLISSLLLLIFIIILQVVGLNNLIKLANNPEDILAFQIFDFTTSASSALQYMIIIGILVPIVFNMVGKTRMNIIRFYGKNTFIGYSAFSILCYSILAVIMTTILKVVLNTTYIDDKIVFVRDIIKLEYKYLIIIIILVGVLIVFLNFIQIIRRTDLRYYTKKRKIANMFLYIFKYIVITALIISVIAPLNYIMGYEFVPKVYDLFNLATLLIFIYVCLDYIITFKEKVFL